MPSANFSLAPEYLAALAVAVASHALAYLLVGLPSARYMAVALGFNAVLLFAWAFFVRLFEGRISKGSAEIRAQERIQRVLSMPFEEVKRRALAMIGDPSKFKCLKVNLSNNPEIEKLGPILKDFFSEFESVNQIGGDFSVSRSAVGASSLRPGLLKIGSDFAHSELVVHPRKDEVFIVTDAEHVLEGLPTIYHNICLLG
jgi:hypothetical protein